MVEIELSTLAPYKSFLVCTVDDKEPLSTLFNDLVTLVKKKGVLSHAKEPTLIDSLEVAAFIYQESIKPSWVTKEIVTDHLNKLVVICRKNSLVAIMSSDPSLRSGVFAAMTKKKGTKFKYLQPVKRGLLNSAFVKGKAHTLWLSGTHKRVPSKVDNKVITGMDLQYALDPLGDQSFFYTAARCELPSKLYNDSVGVSPRKSSVWAGISGDWSGFVSSTKKLLALLENVKKPTDNPLPVLALNITSADQLKGVGRCYDAAFIPPILLAETDIDPDERKEAERWSDLVFDITSKNDSLDFTANVLLQEGDVMNRVGSFGFIFDDTSRLPDIWWQVDGKKDDSASDELFTEVRDIFATHKDWLKAWYDSGHVIADTEIFLPRYRDIPFNAYVGQNLAGYDIRREKPSSPLEKNIGKQKSLFCYVQKKLKTGWLTCDDGSMEMADFIHFETISGHPTLTLIHVKASKNDVANRDIVVADYEIVVSQSVKNIRYLSRENLLGGLEAGLKKKISAATWKDGRLKAGRTEMVAEIAKYGSNLDCRVVVFQPNARKAAIDAARPRTDVRAYKRLQQLDTLLLGAQLDCRAVGAELSVWVDGR